MIQNSQKLLFLSFQDSDYSRSGVYFTILKETGASFMKVESGFLKSVKFFFKLARDESKSNHLLVVMSPSHILAIYARIILRKKVVLDAGWSLTESRISNLIGIRSLIKVPITFLIDFISFNCSKIVILESPEQIEYIRKVFWIPYKKMKYVYTGLNEKTFLKNQSFSQPTAQGKKLHVLFRGKINSEAGIENIAEITRILENEPITFHIQTNKPLTEYAFSKNTSVDYRYLEPDEIAELYLEADICLGQFSRKPRLNRTVPHKFFESLYFGKCYISPRTEPIERIMNSGKSVMLLDDTSPLSVANQIKALAKEPSHAYEIGLNGKNIYKQKLSQKKLAIEFMSNLTFND